MEKFWKLFTTLQVIPTALLALFLDIIEISSNWF